MSAPEPLSTAPASRSGQPYDTTMTYDGSNKPPAASREVVVAVHECLETLKTDKNAHNLGRAAKLLVKLAYLKTPNRIHIARQSGGD